ncbi:unnamed protein product [Ixodes pacificus]
MGVMAIVGPTSAAGSAAVSAVCRRSRVPHLVTLGQDVDEDAVRHPDTSVSVRLSPEQSGLSRALRDLVTRKAWSSFTLLYEDSRGSWSGSQHDVRLLFASAMPDVRRQTVV